ncbi:MAG: type II toxin-antitoxin system RelE/ParE family toxin [Candidatus Microthrix sp.]|nr:type II toxin-antitoxin system RelE/ParE family toxin [Candidatus Microthrix sp.]
MAEPQQDAVIAIVELLAEHGPQLDRPHADRIKGSNYHNLKELRPRGAAKNCRVLFIFDPRRQAILLVGGDKTGQWATWYRTAIPEAEQLYKDYLDELEALGLLDSDEQGQ